MKNIKDFLDILSSRGFIHQTTNLEELEKRDINITHGIVANWGPEHLKTANKLIDLGCKKLIIEKPLSCRKDELQEFKKRCAQE